MARKTAADLRGPQKATESVTEAAIPAGYGSWAAVGVDTSMTALSVVAVGYDRSIDKMVGPRWGEIRWQPEDDYYKRLGEAARGHELVLDVLGMLHAIRLEDVYIAIEEPWYFGATKRGQSAWLKQQAEVSGAFKGSLARWGFVNLYEINNSQWRSTLKHEGVTVRKGAEGKWDVKEWAVRAFGLPELPDLVKSKTGAKIPRPEEGYGAKAKAVQPNDIYDAAAMCAWMLDEGERTELFEIR